MHRKMTEWEWYTDHNTFILFMHLLLTVNYEDKKWRGVEIKRGQILTGRLKLSEETGLSEKSIRTALNKLKLTGEVAIETASKYSVITVCNYDKYQSQDENEGPANRPITGPAMGQQWATTKEVKKERNKESSLVADDRFNLFWEKYPKKVGKKEARKAWEKQKCWNGQFDEVMAGVDTYVKECVGKDNQFIAHPSSWLNGERWKDESEVKLAPGEQIIGGYRF